MRALEFIAPMMVAFAFCALVGWVVWVIVQKRRLDVQAGVQTRLFERFGSAAELAAFFETPAGERLLSSLSTAPARIHSLGSVRAGVVLAFLGAAMLLLEPIVQGSFGGLGIPGTLILSVGVGLVAAALLSRRLARSWGLINEDGAAGAHASRPPSPP
jgi:hypothetical protein